MNGRKTRVPFWDNARFLCIVLVVAGHAVQRMSRDSDPAFAIYFLIYTFHMPAFAIMSGYFSKAGEPSRNAMKRVLTDVFIPYLIFETLWAVLTWAISGQWSLNYTNASWTLWFLLALGVFRIVLPYIALLRAPVAWTLLVSISAGAIAEIDSTFALNRILQLMPFFVIGWWLKNRDIVARFRLLQPRPLVTAAAIALMAAVGACGWIFAGVLREENLQRWFFFKQPYEDLTLPGGGDVGAWGPLVRVAVIAVALVMCLAFFALVPRGEHRWTRLGQYTLYVYLLHTFVLFPAREITGADGQSIMRGLEPEWLWLSLVLLASVLIAVFLSSAPVRRLTKPLIEPNVDWLFIRPVRRKPE